MFIKGLSVLNWYSSDLNHYVEIPHCRLGYGLTQKFTGKNCLYRERLSAEKVGVSTVACLARAGKILPQTLTETEPTYL